MSENKRKKVKVTIEFGDDTRVIECDGVALTAITDDGEVYNCKCSLVGNLSQPDLRCLKDCVEEKLVANIDQHIEPEVGVLLGILEDKQHGGN